MPTQTLEEKITKLEKRVDSLEEKASAKKKAPWWEKWVGAFENNPDFDAAMERGAEYRRSQPTAADEWEENVPA